MRFLKGDIVVNSAGQKFLVTSDHGDLKFITNDPDQMNAEFRLVANSYPELTERGVAETHTPIILDMGEEEYDMYPKDISNEILASFKKVGVHFIDRSNGNI